MNRSSHHQEGRRTSQPERESLDTETVEGSTLSFERVDDIKSGDGLSLGVLGVGDRVSDDVYKSDV
jgi:hypothetical protein